VSLRFLADQCVPETIINAIKDYDFEVKKLKECLPANSSDIEVILKALELESILLTLNGDFADIILFPPEKYKGIVSIQLKNHPETIELLLKRLLDFFNKNSDLKYFWGKLIIVEVHRIRIYGE